MLTDTKLRNLKPKDKLYKVNDRDGVMLPSQPQGQSPFATTTRSMTGKKPLLLAATE